MSIFALTPGALFGSLGKEDRSRPRAEPVSSFLTFGPETPDEPAGLGSATGILLLQHDLQDARLTVPCHSGEPHIVTGAHGEGEINVATI
jgi:hypothetical protein